MEGAADAKDRLEVLHTMRVGEARVLLQVQQKVLLTNVTGACREGRVQGM